MNKEEFKKRWLTKKGYRGQVFKNEYWISFKDSPVSPYFSSQEEAEAWAIENYERLMKEARKKKL